MRVATSDDRCFRAGSYGNPVTDDADAAGECFHLVIPQPPADRVVVNQHERVARTSYANGAPPLSTGSFPDALYYASQ